MENQRRLKLIAAIVSPSLLLLVLLSMYCCYRRHCLLRKRKGAPETGEFAGEMKSEAEDLIRFSGGEELTVPSILDAPGEVVGKSEYATLYRACLQRSGAAVLLRFVRPAFAGRMKDILPAVRTLGLVRHPNLVSLSALYVGPRGEKLFVHPYFPAGTLAQFLHEGTAAPYRWEIIYRLSLGIARGLDHLHTGLQKPIVHGNLKSNNILLDTDYQPRVSDFGLHLLLNPTAAQEMLEASAAQGYKAPELIKMKDATRESDIYSLGVVFLEILTRKDPVNISFLHSKDLHLPTLLRNLILEHKISNTFSSNLLDQSTKQNAADEQNLMMYFQLAMACCSPSSAMRPDIKYVLRSLEEIGSLSQGNPPDDTKLTITARTMR